MLLLCYNFAIVKCTCCFTFHQIVNNLKLYIAILISPIIVHDITNFNPYTIIEIVEFLTNIGDYFLIIKTRIDQLEVPDHFIMNKLVNSCMNYLIFKSII